MADLKPHRACVLVVDDEEGMRDTLVDILGDFAFSVDEARDGQEALEMVKARAYDVVLMDIKMPVLDGIGALGRMKALRPDLPVIMMSAYASSGAVVQVLQQAEAIVDKPLDLEKVLPLVQRACQIASGEGQRESASPEAVALRADEGVGRMVRLAAHDLRNKLGVMRNSVYYLNMKIGCSDPKLAKHLDILNREIASGSRLICDLVDLAAPRAPVPTLVDGEDALGVVLDRYPAPPGVQVLVSADSSLPMVEIDPEQLGRALEHLVVTCWARRRPGEALQIGLRKDDHQVRFEFLLPGAVFPEVDLSVLDLGRAEEWSDGDRGLFIAHRLLAQNGGSLRAEGEEDAAVRFVVAVPICAAEPPMDPLK